VYLISAGAEKNLLSRCVRLSGPGTGASCKRGDGCSDPGGYGS
jgi:hypothetical protein